MCFFIITLCGSYNKGKTTLLINLFSSDINRIIRTKSGISVSDLSKVIGIRKDIFLNWIKNEQKVKNHNRKINVNKKLYDELIKFKNVITSLKNNLINYIINFLGLKYTKQNKLIRIRGDTLCVISLI